ncbi:MAG: YggS family pyridoxal phosphate-dependent enzyme [Clostridiales bacterium]|nr:YggS family pyridoxal phosphate-dependent enzyme [Clostridiales bacterium]
MLAENVKKVQETLRRESAAFGHVPPRLIAVTKYVSGEETLPLQALGVTDIGENRVQVLREKLPVVSGKFSLHLIGRLQNNKVKYIIKDVCLIHSVDNLSLAQEIDRQAGKNGLRMDVLLQVNVTGESQKGGVPPEELMPLLRQVAPLPGVHVRGLMTMMPLGAERDYIFERFRATRQLLERCREEAVAGTDMTELSMGMSQDYDLAARAGATMVRVGSALWRA